MLIASALVPESHRLMLAISLEHPFGLDTYSDLSIIVGYPRAIYGYKGDLQQVLRVFYTYSVPLTQTKKPLLHKSFG